MQETTTGQTATTTSFVDQFQSFIQLSQTNAKEQDVCGGSSMDDVATVQGIYSDGYAHKNFI